MSKKENARCILCDSTNNLTSFPFTIIFNSSKFDHKECQDCHCVFIDPMPSDNDFKKIYQSESYHEEHYVGNDLSEYVKSAKLLSKFIDPHQSNVLDYGCGYGQYLKTLSEMGFKAQGLEFDQAACMKAAEYSGCIVKQIDEFSNVNNEEFQAIHLGDVLEHLPNPRETLIKLISVLSEKGIIFIEGPLEKNPSLVYWSAKLFGHFKKMFRLNEQFGEPTHLIKVNERTQLNFILELDSRINCLHWEVYETGWPYVNNGFLRNIIAQLAIFLGGKKFFSSVMGNRFRGMFTIQASD